MIDPIDARREHPLSLTRRAAFLVWLGLAMTSAVLGSCAESPEAKSAALEDAREARCRGAATPSDAKECFTAGAASDKGGRGRQVNHNKAMALWQIGCKSGQDDRSCVALVSAARASRGDLAASKRANLLLDDLCRSGRPLGCAELADVYDDGRGVVADESRALELDERVCFHGVPVGDKVADLEAQSAACGKVASMLSTGIADPARASAALARQDAVDATVNALVGARTREAAAARASRAPGPDDDSKDARWTAVEETPALGCAAARMTAAQTARCDDWSSISSGPCSCTSVGPQFACTVAIHCY